MTKFADNNTKNASTGHLLFELNYGYYLSVSFEEDTDLCFQSKTATELLTKLQKLMTICRKNLYHAQKL